MRYGFITFDETKVIAVHFQKVYPIIENTENSDEEREEKYQVNLYFDSGTMLWLPFEDKSNEDMYKIYKEISDYLEKRISEGVIK